MLHKLRKKSVITKEEIIADLIFFFVAFLVSVMALYIFDIHWNFYPDGQLFPPEEYVFNDKSVYIYGGLIGAIVGFL